VSRAYVAFGANLGDVVETLAAAVRELRELGRVRAISTVYRSQPIGPPQPDYLNGVLELETELEPGALLAGLHRIEAAHGRVRDVPLGPRTLDLDLIWLGGRESRAPGPQLPHPRAHQREFVLRPLSELAPGLVLSGRTVSEWLDELQPQGVEATAIRLV
jgi:2-amino-4-hydroxy-6-hydroxymethyldihydropteridine diphosphokinase